MWEFLQPERPPSARDGNPTLTDFIRRRAERQILVVGRTKLVKELLHGTMRSYAL
jgi:hypothetical protein